MARSISFNDTMIESWFERDRKYVGLCPRRDIGHPIIEWWDADVDAAVEDGFLDPRNWHQSAYEYAVHLGLVTDSAKNRKNPLGLGSALMVLNPHSRLRGKVRLEGGESGTFLLIDEDSGKDILIQSDWDFPGLASSFGWTPCKKCRATDGTVDCAHRTASEMISEAYDFLVEHEGRSIPDPGYFSLGNPRRPTREFMRRCAAGVGKGYDPGAVCAAAWKKMGAAAKRKWLARENPSGPKCFVCGQPVNKRRHHAYFTVGARTIYLHPDCDPEGTRQDKLMAAWERKHPEGKNPGYESFSPAFRSGEAGIVSAWTGTLRQAAETGKGIKRLVAEARQALLGRGLAAPVADALDADAAALRILPAARAQMLRLYRAASALRGQSFHPSAIDRRRPAGRGNPEYPFMDFWGVYLHGKLIDTVFRSSAARRSASVAEVAEEIRRSLVEHDGYDPAIAVRLSRRKPYRRGNPGAGWHLRQQGVEIKRAQLASKSRRPRAALYLAGRAAAHRWSQEAPQQGLMEGYQDIPPALVTLDKHGKGFRAFEGIPNDPGQAGRGNPGRRHLTCSSCGKPAKGQQWWNRDRGYGLCAECALWIKKEGKLSAEEMKTAYGIEEVHYLVNPSIAEGADIPKLPASEARSYNLFHGVAVGARRNVKAPRSWPRKLWALGKLVSLTVKGGRLSGGAIAVCRRNNRLFIIGAKPGPAPRQYSGAGEIAYAVPRRSGRSFAGGRGAYVHPFDNPPAVKSYGGGFFVIAGRGLKVTRQGIVG
jgi:hypothetical protein